MPTYQYSCTECGHFFEQFQGFSEDSLTVCPQCQGRLRKVFNAVGVVFKGSGFYRTDSRSESRTPAGDSGSGTTKDGGSSEKSTTEKGASSGSAANSGGTGSGSGGGTSGSGTSGGKAAAASGSSTSAA